MEERRRVLSCECQFLIGSYMFSEDLRDPESSTCTADLSIPVETGRPLSCQDDENGLQRRSRFFAPCDVRETVRLGCSVARALLEPILIILQVLALATNYQL